MARAVAAHEQLGAPPLIAEAAIEYASLLAVSDAQEDRAQAAALLDRALAIAQTGDFTSLIADVLAVRLVLAGADPDAPPSTVDLVSDDVLRQRPELRDSTAPDGRVAILFTDIEHSTALSSGLGDDRWIEVLNEHNRIVRDAVAQHSGHEVKGLGDGFMLAFASTAAGLRCAAAIREGIRSWAADTTPPIRVRMGLHAGTPQLVEQDFFGYAVNLAARIPGIAERDQILLSSEVVDELSLVSAGLDRMDGVLLKGIPEPQSIFVYQG